MSLKDRIDRLEQQRKLPAVPQDFTDATGARWVIVRNGLWVPAPVSLDEWKQQASALYQLTGCTSA